MQHCMCMREEKEAEEDKGRVGWTMLEKIQKREAYNYLRHMEKPRIEKFGEV